MNFSSFITEATVTIKLMSIEHEVQGNGSLYYDLIYVKNGIKIYVTANIDFVDTDEDKVIINQKNLEIVSLNLDSKIQDVIDFISGTKKVDAKPKVNSELALTIYKDIESYTAKHTKEISVKLKNHDE